jgi:methionine-rich copper-binding protein CopC
MAMSSRSRDRRRAVPAVLALFLLLMAAVPAVAHSELVSSSPAAGSTVTSAAGMSIVLSFSEALKTGSKADVVGPGGATAGTATIDPSDNTKLTWSSSTALAPGSWTIRWTSIATDGDVLRGTIPFAVTAATPAPSLATSTVPPATTPPATPAASPTPAAASAGAGVIVPLIAALLVIGLLALMLLRNRRPTARR